MDEQQMYSNVVRQMVTSFEKFLEDYEKLPTTATDLSIITKLKLIDTSLSRLLRKHKAAVDLPPKDNCDESNVTERCNSVPTVKANNGETIKQKRVENESNKLEESNERNEVLRKAELSILKSIEDSNSDEESNDKGIRDSKITTSVPSPVKAPTAVEDDPHITKIAFDFYKCEACNVNMSLANATSHILGKPHLKKAKLLSRESSLNRVTLDKPLPDLSYEFIEVDVAAAVYKCTICKVLVSSCENNVKQHVDGTKHKIKKLSMKS